MLPLVPTQYIHFFSLNLHDSILSYLCVKLIEAQELIVQACVWLPDGRPRQVQGSQWNDFSEALEIEKRP